MERLCGHEPHYAKGLCKKCYMRDYLRKKLAEDPDYNKKSAMKTAIKKLVNELAGYPWMSDKTRDAMVLDGDVLEKRLEELE